MPLAGIERGSAQGDALVDGDIVTNLGGFPDDHTHAVINEEAAAESGTGMNLDTRHKARDLRECTGKKEPAMLPQSVVNAIPPNRMQTGIEQHNLKPRACGWVVLEYRGNVFAHQAKVVTHVWVESARAGSIPLGLHFAIL